jgi:iron(III) transport system substrate-binding protein
MKRDILNATRIWGFAAAILFVLSAPLPASPAAAEVTSEEKVLVSAAKKEGEVIFLNPQFQDRTGVKIEAAMRKRYGLGSGFKFKNVRKGTGAVVSTARQEIQSGKFSFDVIMAPAASFLDAAAKNGALLKLESGNWKNHVEQVEKAGQYHNYPYVVATYPFTFTAIWNTSCPGMKDVNITSLYDLLNPAFKGKTIIGDLPRSLSSTTVTLMWEEAGVDMTAFYRKYKELTDPAIIFRSEQRIQAVIACERPVDMWGITSRVYQHSLKKPELKDVLRIGYYKEGQPLIAYHLAVMKGAPHPNAGKLLIDFFLSKEGTDIIVENELMFTFLKDYKVPPRSQEFMVDFTKVKPIGLKNWLKASDEFERLRDAWKKIYR